MTQGDPHSFNSVASVERADQLANCHVKNLSSGADSNN